MYRSNHDHLFHTLFPCLRWLEYVESQIMNFLKIRLIFTPKLGIYTYFLFDSILTVCCSLKHPYDNHILFSGRDSTHYTRLNMGQGNITVISVSVHQVGDPDSRPPRSACHRKVELYYCVIHSFPPVPTTGSKKAVHVLLCPCNNACKRSAICYLS